MRSENDIMALTRKWIKCFSGGVTVLNFSKTRRILRSTGSLYLPLAAGAAILLPGALAVSTHKMILFASLGPTAALMIREPRHPAADWYNALTGHALGIIAAYTVVWLLSLSSTPSVFDQQVISWTRVIAAVMSLTLALVLETFANVQHPPAASTTLMIALGSFRPTWHDGAAILVGVIAVTLAAESIKQVRAVWRRGSANGQQTKRCGELASRVGPGRAP